MMRKYIPKSNEATTRRRYAQQRNWKLLQIAGARQQMLRIAEEHKLPTKTIKGVFSWLKNQIISDYEYD